jgi:hypothetical protein
LVGEQEGMVRNDQCCEVWLVQGDVGRLPQAAGSFVFLNSCN